MNMVSHRRRGPGARELPSQPCATLGHLQGSLLCFPLLQLGPEELQEAQHLASLRMGCSWGHSPAQATQPSSTLLPASV